MRGLCHVRRGAAGHASRSTHAVTHPSTPPCTSCAVPYGAAASAVPWISRTESGRRAKVYSLTRAGRKRLDDETTQWTRRAAAVARLLKAEA